MTQLTRLHLDLRSRGFRKDLYNPYEMHATLERAVNGQGRILWRQEGGKGVIAHVYVQHAVRLDPDVLEDRSHGHPPLIESLTLDNSLIVEGSIHRFRLVANPTVVRNKKRKAVIGMEAQYAWIHRKAQLHGFDVLGVMISGETMVRAKPISEERKPIEYLRVVYDGHLRITNRPTFLQALEDGIGHSKAFGCGLLTLDRVYRRQ